MQSISKTVLTVLLLSALSADTLIAQCSVPSFGAEAGILYPITTLTNSMITGDFNRDGKLDVVSTQGDISTQGALSINLGEGAGRIITPGQEGNLRGFCYHHYILGVQVLTVYPL